jgi:glycerate 2-kinase
MKDLLRRMFEAAVASAQPARVLPAQLPPPPRGRTIVIGAGKASASMARVLEQQWGPGLQGLVVTRYGHAEPCDSIEIVEAAHPVPDAAGHAAAGRMLRLVQGLTADDLVICLLSGGGSALLPLPLPGVTLEAKQALSRSLLRCGASISEINCVRRHLSAVKGGRLAAACHPARVLTLAISDVPGDGPADIASGPTVADPTTCDDALAVLRRYQVDVPAAVLQVLQSSAAETVKPGDPRVAGAEFRLVATPLAALQAAADVARAAGVTPHILGDALEGEAREVGKVLAGIAGHVAQQRTPFAAPCVLLSGGETTVTVRGDGRGGRNVEFLLSFALAMRGLPGVHALAADTDGIDGRDDAAGAIADPQTLARAQALGLSAQQALDANDAHPFFAALGDAVVTGPTRTNVNDFRAIVIDNIHGERYAAQP